ncbi:hypothetical protein GTA62_21205 [Roseobacter sp. HKCCD9010]|nr:MULTISPECIES: hypothetical protein [unclassified Roseobacter]MBF9052528.1 hypothetical protein [Rhodobacterales bacterium HKCCD4356]NNV49471.1 hypothetical protein [Roseobacter sp. HKCCD6265]NNW09075.1 hypothetical protein [Roseobacter sp. HKCCD8431]NNW64517.1 hypothetical protein [Roseobacter sp. HKCCD8268]NNY04961.1 hypothetical protein [Roseobacter sp. HKCCD7635]NNY47711.1 hypothetical protein [Roseobacter sp. HKCCD8801]NOC51910.1 hypothetical protein [Roseobacter sp. HKCCD7386]NPU784
MLRRADRNDLKSIQAVLNAPGNLAKLEGYSDELVLAAISDPSVAFLVWQEGTKFGGFCWLHKSPEDTKIEEFGVSLPGRGVGSRFFAAVLEHAEIEGFPARFGLTWLPITPRPYAFMSGSVSWVRSSGDRIGKEGLDPLLMP